MSQHTVLDRSFVGYSVSWGTLREQDLVDSFLSFLEQHAPDLYASIISQYNPPEDLEEWCATSPDDVSWFLNEYLWNAFQDIAPKGTYFGSHPGDGSDFGFWLVDDDEHEPNVSDYEYYLGDVNLEYGGTFFNLDNWRYGYVEALRVIDLDSGCGFNGAVSVEQVTILIDNARTNKQALASFGWEHIPTGSSEQRKMNLAYAVLTYGYYDTHHTTIIQCESDVDYAPMQYDGWKADVRLSEDTSLLQYLEDNDWLYDFE